VHRKTGVSCCFSTTVSSGTVSRFETEIPAQDENIDALASLNSAWVEKAVSRSKAKKVILDIDSSESPVHGNQEGTNLELVNAAEVIR